MSGNYRTSSKRRHHSHGSQVVKLCSPHYEMLRNLHCDSCYQRPTPEFGHYHCMQPSLMQPLMQPIAPNSCQTCNPSIVRENVAHISPVIEPFNRVGQSETLYLSSTSPRPLYGSDGQSRDNLKKKAPKSIVTDVKSKEELYVVSEELLAEKIRQEIKRNQDAQQEEKKKRDKEVEQEERLKRLEVNYLAPRPEPQFCPPERWLIIPQRKKDNREPKKRIKKQETVEQFSKEEFFECYLPPRLTGSHSDNQIMLKGLITSDSLPPDGLDRSDNQANENAFAKETKVDVNVKVKAAKVN